MSPRARHALPSHALHSGHTHGIAVPWPCSSNVAARQAPKPGPLRPSCSSPAARAGLHPHHHHARVLSLSSSLDRRTHAAEELKRAGATEFTFVDAVDGDGPLPEAEVGGLRARVCWRSEVKGGGRPGTNQSVVPLWPDRRASGDASSRPAGFPPSRLGDGTRPDAHDACMSQSRGPGTVLQILTYFSGERLAKFRAGTPNARYKVRSLPGQGLGLGGGG